MNASSDTEIQPLVRDLRVHWFKAGEYYVREGGSAAIEIIPTSAGPPAHEALLRYRRRETRSAVTSPETQKASQCCIVVVVAPYCPPKRTDPEAVAGAREAVEFARRSLHPRVRAAAEIAAANLAVPPEVNFGAIEVNFWIQDVNEEWCERGKRRLNFEGHARFDEVPRGVNCWIELLSRESSVDPSRQALEARQARERASRSPAPPQSQEAVEPPAAIVQRGMSHLMTAEDTEEEICRHSTLYREFQSERAEILKLQWIESEKAGYQIGFGKALEIWVTKYRARWRRNRQGGQVTRGHYAESEAEQRRFERADTVAEFRYYYGGGPVPSSQREFAFGATVPASGKVQPVKYFKVDHLNAEVAVSDDNRLWLAIHTDQRELGGGTVLFRFGPVLGTVQLQPAGQGWQGRCRLNLPVNQLPTMLERFKPEFFIEPLHT